jgi:hypothetical protein
MNLDFLGQELNVGDVVVYGTAMSQGRGLNIGSIVKFTPKLVEVSQIIPKFSSWRASSSVRCYAKDIMKIDTAFATVAILRGE